MKRETVTFHPGMRVRIGDPNDRTRADLADVLEVVTPESIEDNRGGELPGSLVRESMRTSGIAAALLVKLVGARSVFVFEQMLDGTFRQFRSHEPYTLEAVPVEWKQEVQ
jgi:hypothetical protein